MPACTVLISYVFLGKVYSTKILGSLVIIFFGVVLYAAKVGPRCMSHSAFVQWYC